MTMSESIETTRQGATLTEAAAAKVAELIAAEGDPSLLLRLGVLPGGCSGFTYELFFDSALDPSDIVNETAGVKIAVDALSAEKLHGTVVDYREGGLQGSGFQIENPNQVRSCGCGQSFC